MMLALFGAARLRRAIINAAAVQFPRYLYAIIALRTGNQALLEAEGDEHETAGTLAKRQRYYCWG